jgi:hypothetical protein
MVRCRESSVSANCGSCGKECSVIRLKVHHFVESTGTTSRTLGIDNWAVGHFPRQNYFVNFFR